MTWQSRQQSNMAPTMAGLHTVSSRLAPCVFRPLLVQIVEVCEINLGTYLFIKKKYLSKKKKHRFINNFFRNFICKQKISHKDILSLGIHFTISIF